MKANEAPEKIYMPNELLSEEWTRHIEGEDVEYVRTDTFVEKMKKWLHDNVEGHKLDKYDLENLEYYMKYR